MDVVHLNQKQLAARWHLSEATLERWRSEKGLPAGTDIYKFYDLDWIVTVPNMDPHIKPFEVLKEDDEAVVVRTGFEAIIRKKFADPMPEWLGFDTDTIEKAEAYEFEDAWDERRYFSDAEQARSALARLALWGDRLEGRVVNASISGETTAGGLRRLPEDLKRHRPNLVVIALGANDGLRGQPVAAARANLEGMIRLARAARADPVLVGLMIPPNYGIEYAREFRELYPLLAKKERVPLVPFLLDGVADRRELFLPDQLHPTAEAQPRILDNVWPTLEPLLRRPARR